MMQRKTRVHALGGVFVINLAHDQNPTSIVILYFAVKVAQIVKRNLFRDGFIEGSLHLGWREGQWRG